MSSKRIRLALVGCGQQMKGNLLPFIRRTNCDDIVACIDRDERLAKSLQEETRAQTWARDIQDVDLSAIDAAIVAVPPESSSDIACHLIRRRIPCFVEKPGGPSTPALSSLCTEATKFGTYVQIGFNFRYAETIQRLYEMTRSQREGPCCLTLDYFSKHPSGPQWCCPDAVEAWLRHNGVHALDLARWLANSPVIDVTAHMIAREQDKFLMCTVLHHANRSVSILRAGNQIGEFVIRIALHFPDGTRYSIPGLDSIQLDLDGGRSSGARLFALRNLDHGWSRSGFGPELKQFLDYPASVDSAQPPPPSLEDACMDSQLCDRILECLPLRQARAPLSL